MYPEVQTNTSLTLFLNIKEQEQYNSITSY